MIQLSVVMPCLNEEKTVGICVKKCLEVFKKENLTGEVIVVDNNSTDNSADIAKKVGAKVIFESAGTSVRLEVKESVSLASANNTDNSAESCDGSCEGTGSCDQSSCSCSSG